MKTEYHRIDPICNICSIFVCRYLCIWNCRSILFGILGNLSDLVIRSIRRDLSKMTRLMVLSYWDAFFCSILRSFFYIFDCTWYAYVNSCLGYEEDFSFSKTFFSFFIFRIRVHGLIHLRRLWIAFQKCGCFKFRHYLQDNYFMIATYEDRAGNPKGY